MTEQLTRSDFPIGTEVEYVESGQEAEIVSIREADAKEYDSPTQVFVQMNGLVNSTDISNIQKS